MYLVRRRGGKSPPFPSLPIAYLLWIGGGFVGLHRFYVRNRWGVLYIPLFLAILYGNGQSRDARDAVSAGRNDLLAAEFMVERAERDAAKDESDGAARLDATRADRDVFKARLAQASRRFELWQTITLTVAVLIGLMLVVDAALLPALVHRLREREGTGVRPIDDAGTDLSERERLTASSLAPSRRAARSLAGLIDSVSGFVGEFVGYWSLIAVFVYYFEVIARYVFNSPTNWAHESMFLMFGMQYLLSGAYALREDAHVRVDVIYMHFSPRAKVITNIVTSIFFFIFVVTLLVTGTIFAHDAVNVMEVSFTEWGIQYWPVKITIALGALLLLLQGIAQLIKDLMSLTDSALEAADGA